MSMVKLRVITGEGDKERGEADFSDEVLRERDQFIIGVVRSILQMDVQGVLEYSGDRSEFDADERVLLDSLLSRDVEDGKMIFVFVNFKVGRMTLLQALQIILENQYPESVSKQRCLVLKTILDVAFARGHFMPVQNSETMKKYDGKTFDEIVQLVIDNLDSIHLRPDLLTALFARLHAADL